MLNKKECKIHSLIEDIKKIAQLILKISTLVVHDLVKPVIKIRIFRHYADVCKFFEHHQ